MNKYINKRELISWAAALVIFTLVTGVWLLWGTGERFEDVRDELLEPNPAALQNMHELQRAMAGSAALFAKPAVISICTLSTQFPGGGYHLEGVCSGVIVTPQGHILTSMQIMKINKPLKVVMFEPSRMEGNVWEEGHHHVFDTRLVSKFPLNSVALIKIDGVGLPFANPGNSENVVLGQWCMALSNPLGTKTISSKGVIAALNQSRQIGGQLQIGLFEFSSKGGRKLIGGPLVDGQGSVIGIVVDKNYAVPMDMAADLLDVNQAPVM